MGCRRCLGWHLVFLRRWEHRKWTGVAAVLFSSLLSSALFFALWLALDLLTPISDAITIDRRKGAGIRLAGFLVSLGLLSGWSVAGDWVSASATLKDFVQSSWPAVALTAVAVFVELALRRTSIHFSAKIIPSAVVSTVYIVFGLGWVAARFKASWYRALAITGLRRSSAGGFGSFIPETSAAG